MAAFNYRKGDVTNARMEIICHQVNCRHKMGSGVAKCIKDKFPEVYEAYMNHTPHLGDCQIVELNPEHRRRVGGARQYVANLFAQDNYGYDGQRYTSYDAFYTCLTRLREFCHLNDIKSIAFPERIGSDRGGANWEIIQIMIREVFEPLQDLRIYFYSL